VSACLAIEWFMLKRDVHLVRLESIHSNTINYLQVHNVKGSSQMHLISGMAANHNVLALSDSHHGMGIGNDMFATFWVCKQGSIPQFKHDASLYGCIDGRMLEIEWQSIGYVE
jgi:hypothetical protein